LLAPQDEEKRSIAKPKIAHPEVRRSVSEGASKDAPRWCNAFLGSNAIALLALVFLAAFSLSALAQTPPNPFSLGGIEGAGGRPTSGIAAFILAKQAEFTRAMTAAARAIKTDWRAAWTLMGLALGYGVFHAAGPGHGKAIVASYIVANENALKRGIAIAALAALLQGIVAVLVVAVIVLVLQGARQSITSSINLIETISFAGIALFGFWLLVRKGMGLWSLWTGRVAPLGGHDHFHMPGPEEATRWSRKEAAAAIVSAGLRPCSGAILILVFTLSQGIFWAGIAAVAAMSLGTALTTGGIAAVAVYFKGLALRLASGRGKAALWLLGIVEVLAALAVMLLGLALLIGFWTGAGGA
jgi:nickel/cobalt transporter (NicO) family protein